MAASGSGRCHAFLPFARKKAATLSSDPSIDLPPSRSGFPRRRQRQWQIYAGQNHHRPLSARNRAKSVSTESRSRNRNRDDYRQIFSAVFSDYFLFDRLIGLSNPRLDAQAHDYLQQLHLDHKVKIKDGALSTTALSQGQRKRLALLTAYLEDRSFYLFDEWAPTRTRCSRKFFITQLLPELKARGKTVLVITHDDKYFHLADRFIKLDYWQIEQGNTDRFRIICGPPAQSDDSF